MLTTSAHSEFHKAAMHVKNCNPIDGCGPAKRL